MIWEATDFLQGLETEAQGLSIKQRCPQSLHRVCPSNPLTLETCLSTAAVLIFKSYTYF